jgi:hypothetical protein
MPHRLSPDTRDPVATMGTTTVPLLRKTMLPGYRRCAGWLILVSVILTTVAGGCGPKRTVATVSGKVTYRGKPVAFGTVNFRLRDGTQISRGIIKPDGTFQMQTSDGIPGADLGVNLVRITCYEIQNPSGAKPDPRFKPFGRLLIPPKYIQFETSGLTVDVQPDKANVVAFELTD